MKSCRPWFLTVAALAFVAATPAIAAVEMLNIDPGHTNVGFSVRHFFTPVKGEFKDVKGTIAFDKDSPSASKVDVTIQAASINTNQERRDGHLKTEDFFWVEKNPEIKFVSKSITVGKDNKGTMTGDLTMRGVTRPITLDVEVLGIMAAGKMGSVAGFSARGKVNRKDYGINWNRVLDNGSVMLADDVDILIDVEAKTPQAPKPAEAPAVPAPDKK